MGWLGDGSHRGQVHQAWTAVGLPPRYPQSVDGSLPEIVSDCTNLRLHLTKIFCRFCSIWEISGAQSVLISKRHNGGQWNNWIFIQCTSSENTYTVRRDVTLTCRHHDCSERHVDCSVNVASAAHQLHHLSTHHTRLHCHTAQDSHLVETTSNDVNAATARPTTATATRYLFCLMTNTWRRSTAPLNLISNFVFVNPYTVRHASA